MITGSIAVLHFYKPAVLCNFHPVHAGDGVLHRKHMKDLCFLNTTQDHLLGVFKAESQYWMVN